MRDVPEPTNAELGDMSWLLANVAKTRRLGKLLAVEREARELPTYCQQVIGRAIFTKMHELAEQDWPKKGVTL